MESQVAMPDFYHSKYRTPSARLKNADYRDGTYFITLCAKDMKCIFGDVVDGVMVLNPFGQIVKNEWELTGQKRSNVILDTFVVMPDHFHAIIQINCDGFRGLTGETDGQTNKYALMSPPPGSLAVIIRAFKSATTKRMRENGYRGDVWQPRFHDHIIRDGCDHSRIREYIVNNPVVYNTHGA